MSTSRSNRPAISRSWAAIRRRKAGWRQMSVSERNLLGTGRYGKIVGDLRRISFAAPNSVSSSPISSISGSRRASICSPRQTLANSYLSYGTESYGGSFKLGIPLREDLALQLRYSIYTQKITLPSLSERLQQHQSGFLQHLPDAGRRCTAAGVRSVCSYPGYNPAHSGQRCYCSTAKPRCRCGPSLPPAPRSRRSPDTD